MVRPVQQIEQELIVLDRSVAAIATEFQDTYRQYLVALGKAVRQQLILATYHLCTHGYPERFLLLSLAQRQDLQQLLQQLARQTEAQLQDQLQSVQTFARLQYAEAKAAAKAALANLAAEAKAKQKQSSTGSEVSSEAGSEARSEIGSEAGLQQETEAEAAAALGSDLEGLDQDVGLDAVVVSGFEPGSEIPGLTPEDQAAIRSIAESDLEELGLGDLFSGDVLPDVGPLDRSPGRSSGADLPITVSIGNLEADGLEPEEVTVDGIVQSVSPELLSKLAEEIPDQEVTISPKTIAHWQSSLEQAIVEQLQTLSHTANRLLQQAKILPSRLPEPVLEVAAKADVVSETAAGPPNLLSLLIESENGKETSVTRLLTVRLRLSEIEFSDPTVGIWRSKIRNLIGQLNKLGREYQKRQKEKAIAQAEAAWRSSWFEES